MRTFDRQHVSISRLLVTSVLLASLVCGCSRSRYRQAADSDSHEILAEKTAVTPWELPPGFTIQPHPASRLAYPSDLDDPLLPEAGPFLYSYQLPQRDAENISAGGAIYERNPVDENSVEQPKPKNDGPILPMSATGGIQQNIHALTTAIGWRPTNQQGQQGESNRAETDGPPVPDGEYGIAGLPIQPIPEAYWNAVPTTCLSRMLEFETVRAEYRRQYNSDPPQQLLDPARKLSLDDIVEFGLLNSRQFQTQKETLYQTALALTLQRYDYATKFSAGATGAAANYTHNRTAGNTVNTLLIPSAAQGDRMLATGGTLLARFANNVVLTFNGPNGFVSDVNSDLLFDVTQSVFQRDTLLNRLVQSERNVVFAARDYARFRKTFFLQLASQYYTLLQTYRQIEIATANYFSLVRALEQAEAEVRSGEQNAPSRVQADQIEQNVLNGRSSLISTCNTLERSLDQLKLAMGLPTEMPINLNLFELEKLTLRDEIEATGELVRRTRDSLQEQMAEQPPDRAEIVGTAVVLVERLLEWLRLRQQLEQETIDTKPLHEAGARLRVDEARIDADRVRAVLQSTKAAQPPAPPIFVLQRTMSVIDALLTLAARQTEFATLLDVNPDTRSEFSKRVQDLQQQVTALHERLDTALQPPVDQQLQTAEALKKLQEELKQLQQDSERLLLESDAQVRTGDQLIGAPAQHPMAAEELQKSMQQADQLVKRIAEMMQSTQIGLVPVDIHVDDAMVTALVQRLDLMNTRGFLADDWRRIKFAADELKSVLNLNANQRFNTSANSDRFAEFAFNDSQTQLNLSLDLPLNRRAQRNAYRQSLINYQVGLRSLMQTEDNIKFDVRNGLRQLELDKVQYEISVTSAALASERVSSTRLEFALGQGGVTARDFLEAQAAYRSAVTQVANGRIGYIVDRAQFALDLELMLLNDEGFWPQIYEEQYQPTPNVEYAPDAGPTYGDIPEFLKVSRKIKRMLHYGPPGISFLAPLTLQPEPADTEPVPPAPEPVPLAD